MDPREQEDYKSRSLSSPPYNGYQAPPQPQIITGNTGATGLKSSSRKGPNKLVIIIVVGVVLLLIMAIAVAISSQGNKDKNKQQNQSSTDSTQAQSLQPAQAIDLEQANNAISQDLSSIDDETDFPATSLDDKALGL